MAIALASVLAFVYGFLMHADGDVWAHTFVNHYAKGVFPSLVDHVLLLAVEGRTLLEDLDASRQALADSKANKVGLVLTKPRRRWFTRR